VILQGFTVTAMEGDMSTRRFARLAIFLIGLTATSQRASPQQQERDLLYVGVPNNAFANALDYGGVGIIAFDAKDHYRFVKRIPTWKYVGSSTPEAVRGIAASVTAGLLYLTTPTRLAAFDLVTDKMAWEQTYDGKCCDRLTVSPDGKTLYVPGNGGAQWYAAAAKTGNLIAIVPTPKTDGAHNTIWSVDGSRVFMSGQRSATISVSDPQAHTVVQTVGPFSNFVRPFTINGSATYLFANVNELLGFEIADLRTGKMVRRVEVEGFTWKGNPRIPHGVPSHGIAMSPNEKEIWVADGVNLYVHVFDATVMPPKQVKSIKTRGVPAWITFGVDGKFAYLSCGEVINATTKEVVAGLTDEAGRNVESEKQVEVVFANGKPVRTVDPFGVGQVRAR
jgi:DNA-binding beta-propeller fold protein YncE